MTIASGAAAADAPKTDRPWNVVILLADDLGWSDLACQGGDLHRTPELDKLARQCVRFTDAYSAAPVCTPTRASIHTGKYPARLHMTTWRESSDRPVKDRKLLAPITVGDLRHEETTFAEVLHAAGYATAHVGKWHLGDAAFFPETQGFDVNIGGTHWGAPATYFFPYSGQASDGFRYVPHLEFGAKGEYLTDRLTDEALRVLDRVADRPFFLNLCWHAVHTPIEAPDDQIESCRERLGPDMNHTNPIYAAMVETLDRNVGRVLAKLDSLGVADRTVVIFTSDNGGYVNQFRGQTVTNNAPLRSGKGSLYEGGVRVPLLIRWPGVTPKGAVCREPVSTVDFYPTILQITGQPGDAKHNAAVDGVSLTPLLREPSGSLPRKSLFWHFPHYYATTTPVSSIRRGDWKLLEYFEDSRVELYNLAEDLGETRDQASARPELADALLAELRQWRSNVHAQMPSPGTQKE
jgi:arylsulfatase A-like enzyme